MRLAVLGGIATAIAACSPYSSGGECHIDSHCSSGEVCARDGTCWPASQVRSVATTWTVHGMPASVVTCGNYPDLFIEFYGGIDDIGYAPVPCRTGLFTIVNLPESYDEVELGVDGGWTTYGPISAQGTASFDLLF